MATKKDEEEVADGREQGIGQLDPSGWDEQPAVTGRPNDLKISEQKPVLENSTMGSRAKARVGASKKAMADDQAENKAVSARSTASKSK